MKRTLIWALFLTTSMASADEGMWTVDNFPRVQVEEKYGVRIDDDWLRTVQNATVRISGCTGSLVSPDGLVLTNRHCVDRCVAQLSSAERDLVQEGFVASRRRSRPRWRARASGRRTRSGRRR